MKNRSKRDNQYEQGRIYKKPGLPPGTLVFTGKRKVQQTMLHITKFDDVDVKRELITNGDVSRIHHGTRMTWIDVIGIHDVTIIEQIGLKYKISNLLLEDILDVDQVPKYMDLDNGNFLSFQSFSYDKTSQNIIKEQISIFFTETVIISFQENVNDTFQPIHERVDNAKSRFRTRMPDYMAYALIDLIVDKYNEATQYFEDKIEEMEYKIETNPDKTLKQEIFKFRREFINFLKTITPIQEAIIKFKSSTSESIKPETKIYLADLLDHAQHVSSLADTYNEMIYALYDLFHAELNYRANSVIKILTVISTIFIPLTFIVGVYGMNFDQMPELRWRYGYPAVWIFMVLFTFATLIYFKYRKWT